MPQIAPCTRTGSSVPLKLPLDSYHRRLPHDVLGPRFWCYLQTREPAVLYVTLHRCPVRSVEFKIGGPLLRPCGQKLDASAIALHQHLLQRNHSRTAVIQVRNPIVASSPKPQKSLPAVSSELTGYRFLCFRCQTQNRGLCSVLTPTGVLREESGGVGVSSQLKLGFAHTVETVGERNVKFRVFGIAGLTISFSRKNYRYPILISLSRPGNFPMACFANGNRR